MSTRLLTSLFLASLPLVACSDGDGTSTEPVDDNGPEGTPDDNGPIAAPGPGAYLRVWSEQACPATGCDGFAVAQVGKAQTRCADGSLAAQCEVDAIDWQQANLTQESLAEINASLRSGGDHVLLRGTLAQSGSRSVVNAEAGWIAVGSDPGDGALLLVRDTGVRCVTTPCVHYVELNLGTGAETPIADVDFSQTGASDRQIAAAEQALASDGVILSGTRVTVSGPGGTAPGRDVTRFWLSPTVDTCYIGGCSGELCTDQPDQVSPCIWRPEYACYQTATCARQGDGACGWTPTESLEACLASPPTP